MFGTLIIFTILTVSAAITLPPYIHACGRKNSNLDKCITNSIEDLKERICTGIPELEAPPLVPFGIDLMTISDSNNVKFFIKDSKITGICDFILNSLHIELDKLLLNFIITFPKVYINSTYDFDIRVLVPFVHNGPIYLTIDNVVAKASLNMKMITNHGKRYVYIAKINWNLNIKGLKIEFDMNESAQLNEIISSFVGSNEKEFIARVKPSLEEEVSKKILLIGNNIVKHFTFDELFPDRA